MVKKINLYVKYKNHPAFHFQREGAKKIRLRMYNHHILRKPLSLES